MASAGESDWVSAAAGGVIFLAVIACAGVYAVDRFQAATAPKQYAAAQAQQQVQRAQEDAAMKAKAAEDEEARAEKAKTEQEEAQAYASAKNAIESVRSSLADPDSALFKDVWAVRGKLAEAPEGVFACGTVNAKNGFGGYVGYTPFVAIGSTVLTPQDGIFEGVFQEVCLDGKKLFPVQV
ncbi:hypothetical protein [Caulobacter sp. Root1472]|uniref:hypothetical protein n=1 Tax=Caulobacter sp. Root1472 TaxID=1736470 RepID=UPI000A85025A|nr:hypothetical protein [Caulobacter sp. Root1472]